LLIGDNVFPTSHPLIKAASEDSLSWETLRSYLVQFEQAIESNDVEKSRLLLVESIKGFTPQCDVADLVQQKNLKTADESHKDNIIQNTG
jgi:FlaA1/EpsC-like NDP-sugar epimerase